MDLLIGCLKILAAIACTTGFVYLTYSTFGDYMRGRTTIVKSTEPLEFQEQTKMLPFVVVCSKRPFVDTMMEMSTVHSYIKNTISVSSNLTQDYYIYSFMNNSVRSLKLF